MQSNVWLHLPSQCEKYHSSTKWQRWGREKSTLFHTSAGIQQHRAFSKIFFKRECILNEQTISGTRSAKSETVYIKVLRFTLADGSREVMFVPWGSSENLKTYSILCKSVLKVKTNNRKLKKKKNWGVGTTLLLFKVWS